MSVKRYIIFGLIFLIILFPAGCKKEEVVLSKDRSQATSIIQQPDPASILSVGNRLLGINVSESEKGFEPSFAVARQAGIQMVELNLPWNLFETTQGCYDDPWAIFKSIPFYGYHHVQILFSLAVINTVERTSPDYLKHLSYDDPQYIAAFTNLMDWIMASIPSNVTIAALAIGNEVDLFLTGREWEAYTRFYRAATEYLHAKYPTLKIGVKVTVTNTILKDQWLTEIQALNQTSDMIMLNYYPQDDQFRVLAPELVYDHFDRITNTFAQKAIWLTEAGYQSGSRACDSSEAQQACFYHELFNAWDQHADQIETVIINWLHDQPDKKIKEWQDYYGSSSPGFVEYLSTLGLRNHNHTDKLAWRQILVDTQARGWARQ